MKRTLTVVGALACGLLGRHLVGHFAGALMGVAIGSVVMYFAVNLPGYLRADPKQLLAFHKDNDFSKTFRTVELESLLDRLASRGLLKGINLGDFSCSVHAPRWASLSPDEKEAFCRLCHEVCRRETGMASVTDFNVFASDREGTPDERDHLAHFLNGEGLTS